MTRATLEARAKEIEAALQRWRLKVIEMQAAADKLSIELTQIRLRLMKGGEDVQ
ncbi:MAG: hypothetical protein Q4F99_02895 [bacterium]|nr:hypothetical protein [bacterium]